MEIETLHLTGLAAVPEGAQPLATVTVRKSRRVEGMDETKLAEALKEAGVADEHAEALATAVLAEEPQEAEIAKAVKAAFPEPAVKTVSKQLVGRFADGTEVYSDDSPQMQAAVKQLAEAEMEKAKSPYPFLNKLAPMTLDAGLRVRTKDTGDKLGEELAAVEKRLAAVAMPSGPLSAVNGFEDAGGSDVPTFDEYETAAKEWAKAEGVEGVDVLAGFRETEKGREMRRKMYLEEA